ncbi:MAG: hypothetical protein ACI8UO_005076 [Verrucomicrobiales bacterium]|jgi:hypothetical protein
MKALSTLLIAASILSAPNLATAIVSDQANAENDPRKLQAHVARKMNAQAFPYWMHVGRIDRSTGVYLGNGYVLTAAHVGAGNFDLSDGTSYSVVPNSARILENRDGSQADFCLFRVKFNAKDSIAKLPPIQLATIAPTVGANVLLIGNGMGGSDSKANGAFPWKDNHQVRWGVNQIEEIYSQPMPTHDFLSYGYATRFEKGGIECQATPGDSGGACFRYNEGASRWELAGIIVAVDSEHGLAEYGNQTYIADPVLFKGELAAAFQTAGRSLVAAR